METAKWKESYLFQGLPTYEQDLLEKCNERGKELIEMDNIPGIVRSLNTCFVKLNANFSQLLTFSNSSSRYWRYRVPAVHVSKLKEQP